MFFLVLDRSAWKTFHSPNHDLIVTEAEESQTEVMSFTLPFLSLFLNLAPSETGVTPPRLGELSASDILSSSLRLSWSVAAGRFDSFLIQYKDAEGQPQSLPVDGGSREVPVSSLLPSRRYKFNLFGLSGRKRIGPVSTDAVTGQLGPPSPLSPNSFPPPFGTGLTWQTQGPV